MIRRILAMASLITVGCGGVADSSALTGTVVDRQGVPVAGACVFTLPGTGPGVRRTSTEPAFCDGNGAFRLAAIAEGDRLLAIAPGVRAALSDPEGERPLVTVTRAVLNAGSVVLSVPWRREELGTLRVQAPSVAGCAGFLCFVDGVPYEGPSTEWKLRVEGGEAVLDQVVPGTRRVRVPGTPATLPWESTLDVGVGATVELALAPPSRSRIAGRTVPMTVVTAEGEPLPMAVIEVESAGFGAWLRTDAEGRGVLRDLPEAVAAGEIRFSVSADGRGPTGRCFQPDFDVLPRELRWTLERTPGWEKFSVSNIQAVHRGPGN